jgi:hypothetical protein
MTDKATAIVLHVVVVYLSTLNNSASMSRLFALPPVESSYFDRSRCSGIFALGNGKEDHVL